MSHHPPPGGSEPQPHVPHPLTRESQPQPHVPPPLLACQRMHPSHMSHTLCLRGRENGTDIITYGCTGSRFVSGTLQPAAGDPRQEAREKNAAAGTFGAGKCRQGAVPQLAEESRLPTMRAVDEGATMTQNGGARSSRSAKTISERRWRLEIHATFSAHSCVKQAKLEP